MPCQALVIMDPPFIMSLSAWLIALWPPFGLAPPFPPPFPPVAVPLSVPSPFPVSPSSPWGKPYFLSRLPHVAFTVACLAACSGSAIKQYFELFVQMGQPGGQHHNRVMKSSGPLTTFHGLYVDQDQVLLPFVFSNRWLAGKGFPRFSYHWLTFRFLCK